MTDSFVIEFQGGPWDGEIREVDAKRTRVRVLGMSKLPPDPMPHMAPFTLKGVYVKRKEAPVIGDPWPFTWIANEEPE